LDASGKSGDRDGASGFKHLNWHLNWVFDFAALFAILAGIALYQGVDALRWHDRRRLWIALAALQPLGLAICGALWIGAQHPTFNFWGNLGFGPGWECENLGRGAAQVCKRDLPARYQPKAAGTGSK
jgi:hypothetical protein